MPGKVPARPEQAVSPNPSEVTLIKLSRVIEKTGLSKTFIYTHPGFPKPVKLGERAVAWIEREVDEWIAARIAESRGASENQ